MHEGWNYYSWALPADYPRFRYYRFYGSVAGSCKVNEIKFIGVETIDDTNPAYDCPVKLNLNGIVTDLASSV